MKGGREKETLLIKQSSAASSLKEGTRASSAGVEGANISLACHSGEIVCQGARVEYPILLHGDWLDLAQDFGVAARLIRRCRKPIGGRAKCR